MRITILSRDSTLEGEALGLVTHPWDDEPEERVAVRWPNGSVTRPHVTALEPVGPGVWRIAA